MINSHILRINMVLCFWTHAFLNKDERCLVNINAISLVLRAVYLKLFFTINYYDFNEFYGHVYVVKTRQLLWKLKLSCNKLCIHKYLRMTISSHNIVPLIIISNIFLHNNVGTTTAILYKTYASEYIAYTIFLLDICSVLVFLFQISMIRTQITYFRIANRLGILIYNTGTHPKYSCTNTKPWLIFYYDLCLWKMFVQNQILL